MSTPGIFGRQPLFKYTPLERLPELITKIFQPLEVEVVDVKSAVGRYLARNVISPINVPEVNISHVDGYAISECSESLYKVVDKDWLNRCEAKYVETGQPVPESTMAVIPVEAVRLIGNEYVEVRGRFGEHREVVEKGSDVKAGELISKKGQRITPQLARLLMELGFDTIEVYRKPRVLVLPVGSEFVNGLKRESSSVVVKTMCKAVGAYADVEDPIEDSVEVVRMAVTRALGEYDVVVTIGGVSMGKADVTLRSILEIAGSQLHVRGISVQPGRTTSLVSVGGKPIVMLPGLIQSTVAGTIFAVQPLLKRLQGDAPIAHYPIGLYKLARNYVYTGRFSSFTRIRFAKLVDEDSMEITIEEAPSPIQRVINESYGFILLKPGLTRLEKGMYIKLYRAPGLYMN